MPPLYITQQGAKLRIQDRRLVVEHEGNTLLNVPLGHISSIMLFGNINLTTPAISLLLENNLEVIFLSADGNYKGRLSGDITPHVPIRRAQYRCLDDPHFPLDFSKGIVQAKLVHQRTLLRRHARDHDQPPIWASLEQLERASAQVNSKTTLSALRGVEGAATAGYFHGLRCLLDPKWRFEKRVRRPPTDPVNVLLSLGYTLLTQVATGAVQAVGLDPYAGFFHETVYNRPALALDLVEEFRPVVDGVVLWCLNGNQLSPDDFTPGPPERPIVLGEHGRKRFLQAFEQRLETRYTHPRRGEQLTLRQCFIEQARQIAQRVQSGQAGYQGMGFR